MAWFTIGKPRDAPYKTMFTSSSTGPTGVAVRWIEGDGMECQATREVMWDLKELMEGKLVSE